MESVYRINLLNENNYYRYCMKGHWLHTFCVSKHLVIYQTSIREKRKATEINLTDADGFVFNIL